MEKNSKILVTGCGGMVGSFLCSKLFKLGYRNVVGTFYQPTIEMNRIEYGSVILKELDVRQKNKVLNVIKEKPNVIFHLAAQSFPVVSWKRPSYTFDVNAIGMINILESVLYVKRNIDKNYNPRIIVITSSAIYGDALKNYNENNLPSESCDILPLHPYGVSKAAEDLLCFQYFKNFNLDIVRIRLFNCTGPNKTGDVSTDFAKRALKAIKNNNRTLNVGNLDSKRAILDVRDLCNALLILAEKGVAGEAYNVCSEHIFKMSYIIDCLEKVLRTKFNIVQDKKLFRPADEPLYAGNCEKIKKLGWREEFKYIDTIKSIVDYLRSDGKF